jgi:hypothetical protein
MTTIKQAKLNWKKFKNTNEHNQFKDELVKKFIKSKKFDAGSVIIKIN